MLDIYYMSSRNETTASRLPVSRYPVTIAFLCSYIVMGLYSIIYGIIFVYEQLNTKKNQKDFLTVTC